VFSSTVARPEDVGGWQKLQDEDFEHLSERITESVREAGMYPSFLS
jgi:hypothetical protein